LADRGAARFLRSRIAWLDDAADNGLAIIVGADVVYNDKAAGDLVCRSLSGFVDIAAPTGVKTVNSSRSVEMLSGPPAQGLPYRGTASFDGEVRPCLP
jgi:hypothetical protein